MDDQTQQAIAAEIQRRADKCTSGNPKPCREWHHSPAWWCDACLLRASTGAPAPAEGWRDSAAARSAAERLPQLLPRPLVHAYGVSECLPCTARFLAGWVLDVLGPEPARPVPSGPADPPRRKPQPEGSEHPTDLPSPVPASPSSGEEP